MRRVELRWLTSFLAVVEHQGFANAAEALHCSQPTISGQVAALERDLGTPLVERSRRPVELTPAGQAFLPHARGILAGIDSGRGTVAQILGLQQGEVKLGTYPSATAGYLPHLLTRFTRRYPGIRVGLVELGGADLASAAMNREVDLFLRQTTPPLPETTFDRQPMWTEPFKVVIPPDHPFAKDPGPMAAAVLLETPIIVTGRFRPDSILTHPFWRSLGRLPTVAYEVGQPQSLIELARAGLGVGVTTQLALNVSNPHELVIRDIDDPQAVREVAVYTPRQRTLSPATHAMLQCMLTEAPPAGTRRRS